MAAGGNMSWARRERADCILDVVKDLLLRWGYRRVTIEEIAKRAGIGKGTIYLHWPTRERLFSAVAAREAAAMTDMVVVGMRTDVAEIMPHRVMRRIFLEAIRRPVLRAIYTRDAEIMGALATDPAGKSLESAKLIASREYLEVLSAHGLLRSGLQPQILDYMLTATVFGFFAAEPLMSDELGLGLDDKADYLADTLRHAFETSRPPTKKRLSAAADKVIAIYEELARDYRISVYGVPNE